jgi:gliding motility-associated-like protein
MQACVLRPLLFLLLLIIQYKSYATHIVGGVLNYRYLGNSNYEIHLTVFRDCNPSVTTPFDNPARVGIFDGANNFINDILIPISPIDSLTPSINSPCFTPPTSICYERAQYFDTINLPPTNLGYQLAYQRCCRNGTIQNIVTPLQIGATYYASLPSNTIAFSNSNPTFTNLPPLFLCLNYPYTFDHSATDLDSDSLVYSLYTPLEGGSQGSPSPNPTNPPPYFPLSFQPPYNLSNVMGGVPLTINPQTGSLTVTPNTQGQFVVGVQVAEYRNGFYLGATKRDVQFNVVPCPNLIVSEIVIPVPSLQAIVACGSNTVQFNNNSFGAVNYKWNFGDPTTTSDTSSLFQPSYTYPGPGTYQSYLVAFSSNPNCNDTSFATVKVYPPFTADFASNFNPCTRTVSLTDLTTFPGHPITSRSWNFGDGSTSTLQNPTHTYANPGTYTITMQSASNLGCSGSKSITITVPSVNTLSVAGSTSICLGDSTQISVSGGFDYSWFPTSSLSNPSSANPIAFPSSTTTYSVLGKVLTSTGDTCSANQSVTVTVNALAQAAASVNPISCGKKTIPFTNTSLNALSYAWNFGDPSSTSNTSLQTNPVHLYSDTGVFQIRLVAYTQAGQQGCTDTTYTSLHIYPPIIAGFDYEVESCSNTVSFFDSTADAFSHPSNWVWDFGDGQFSFLQNPVHVYSSFGNFNASLIASTWVGCKDTLIVPINLTALAAAVGPNDTSLCDSNPVEISASGGIAYLWTPAIGLSSDTVANPTVTINQTTTYTVAITAIAADGDTCVISKNVTVFVPSGQLPALTATVDKDTIYAGESTTLHAIPDQSNLFYNWTPASWLNSAAIANPVATPLETITYQVVLSDSFECVRNADVKIVVIQLSCGESEVFIPNSFTPNNDGENDILFVRGNQIKELYFIVYNRWGEKVFETNNPKSGWDGIYKGVISEPGVFAYYARIICLNNDELIKQGNVTLLR